MSVSGGHLKQSSSQLPEPKLVDSGEVDSPLRSKSMGRNNRCTIEDMDMTQSYLENLVVCYEESRSEGDVWTVCISSNIPSLEIRKESQAKEREAASKSEEEARVKLELQQNFAKESDYFLEKKINICIVSPLVKRYRLTKLIIYLNYLTKKFLG